ncbi:MAG TPA: nucleotidyl transferase AbiEii/AbiGii toxin family protein [Candidatus Obscuribacterales bacterium]
MNEDRPPRNIAASVHQRLLNRSRRTGEDFQFLLQRYAAERFLYRLGKSRHRNRFVLKGAMLYALWGGSIYRATRDLDFTGYGDSDSTAVLKCFQDICCVSTPDDGIEFRASTVRVEPILDQAEYHGLRLRFQAFIGTAQIAMQVDVGFGNAIEPPAIDVEYPTLLNSPAPNIRAYPHEAVVAEKLHAMHRLGEANSRLKDFYDLYVLSRQFDFDGARLAEAILATFKRRGTPIDLPLPAALAPRFYSDAKRTEQWRAYLKRNSLPAAPEDFTMVGDRLRTFLEPVWSALTSGSRFARFRPAGADWTTDLAHIELSSPSKTPDNQSQQVSQSIGTGILAAHPTPMDINPSTRSFKPYPAYKPSAVQWLDTIPAHWHEKPLKFVTRINPDVINEATPSDFELLYLDISNVDSQGNIGQIETMRFETAPSRARRRVKAGDTVLSTVRTYLKAIAFLSDPPENLIVSTGFAVLRPTENLYAPYLWRAVHSHQFIDTVVAYSEGIGYPSITPTQLGRLVVPVPPFPEQQRITAFLDRETAKIDALVAKKERLIELLQEKRTALITHAVTKGLDPNVSTKASEVEWLQNIPAHWEMKKLKYISPFITVGIVVNPGAYVSDEGLPYIYGAEIREGVIDVASARRITATDSNRNEKTKLQTGDLVTVLVGAPGVTAVVPPECAGGNCASVMLMRKGAFDSHWLCFAMNSRVLKYQVELVQYGAAQEQFNIAHAVNFVVPVPPLSEQHQIASFLRRESTKIDALASRVREAIDRLKEYRAALIAAAVTGKIDVRETAA